ncbi:MAG: hypothetical protein M5U28_02960 [Sandaracinaceae bacterium]|nr:hypothetical protein [Sandaracinaceae bacterium]
MRARASSGLVIGAEAASSSIERSWRTVTSFSSPSRSSRARARRMISALPAKALNAVSAPVRMPVCSSVTSVLATHAARALSV